MTKRAGSHHINGFGGTVEIPAIDVSSIERNVIGNYPCSLRRHRS